MSTQDDTIHNLVDHLFRHKSGQMVAVLTRLFGLEHMQLAEDVVQDTLMQALRTWPYQGVPDNPGGWLMQVAKHRAIDILRRRKVYNEKIAYLGRIESDHAPDIADLDIEGRVGDDQLTMLFIGCHPILSRPVQITLLLKTSGGFGVPEISRAFLLPETTIAQRLVRAKRRIREEGLIFELPPDDELPQRLNSVLAVLYLIFNEGYLRSQGNDLVSAELCHEAIRLCELLIQHPLGDQPHVHALLALMYFQVSRLAIRTGALGELLLLADQDRSQWDRQAINQGMLHMDRAAAGDTLTEYHLLAGIAACHATAPTYAETNWQAVLRYYDALLHLNDSPVFALNRAVALAEVEGPDVGLHALNHLKGLDHYHLLAATYGTLYQRKGQKAEALKAYRRAIGMTSNRVEQDFLRKRIDSLNL